MHRAWVRTLFAIGSFVPGVGVVGLAIWMVNALGRIDPGHLPKVEMETVIAVLVGSTLVAFWQMAMGIVVAIHTSGRKDMSSGAKAGWTLACLFVGSFALPLFTFIVLPGAALAHSGGPAPLPGDPRGR